MHNMDKLCLDQTFSLPWTSAGNPLAPHCCLAILGTLLHHGHLLSYSEGEVILGEEFLFMFCNRSSSVWEEMARPLLKSSQLRSPRLFRFNGDAVGLCIVDLQQLYSLGSVWRVHLLAASRPHALQAGHGTKLFTGDFAV